MLSYVEVLSLLESDHAVLGENDECVVCGKCTCFGVKDVPMGYHQKQVKVFFQSWGLYKIFRHLDLIGDLTCGDSSKAYHVVGYHVILSVLIRVKFVNS